MSKKKKKSLPFKLFQFTYIRIITYSHNNSMHILFHTALDIMIKYFEYANIIYNTCNTHNIIPT